MNRKLENQDFIFWEKARRKYNNQESILENQGDLIDKY